MSWLSPEIMNALGLTVMDALWQGAILLVIGILFVFLFGKSSSKIKYRVLVSIMLLMPVWSVISFNGHYEPVTFVEPVSFMPQETLTADLVPGQIATIQQDDSQRSVMDNLLFWMNKNASLTAYLWLLGVLIFVVRLTGGLIYVRYIRQSSESISNQKWIEKLNAIAAEVGVKGKVLLKESVKVSSPITIGFLKPIIIFPIGLIQGLPTDQIEAILAHEMAHIKRLDYIMNIVLSALQVIYFFHPAYWWLYKQAEVEREYHCDQLAIDYVGSKMTLIKALTSVQELKMPGLIPAMGFARRKNQLLIRIMRIAEGRQRTNWFSGIISIALIAGAFVLMSWQGVKEQQSEPVVLRFNTQKVTQFPDSLKNRTVAADSIEIYPNDLVVAYKSTMSEPVSRDTLPGNVKSHAQKIAETRVLVDSLFSEMGSAALKNRVYALIDDLETIDSEDSVRQSEMGEKAILLLAEFLLEMGGIEPKRGALEEHGIDIEQQQNALLEVNGELMDWSRLDEIEEKGINAVTVLNIDETNYKDLENEKSKVVSITTKLEIEMTIERMEEELLESQEKFEKGLITYDEKQMSEALVSVTKINNESVRLLKESQSDNVKQELRQLLSGSANKMSSFERRLAIMKKYSSSLVGETRAITGWSPKRSPESPITKTVLNGYELLEFNVTESQARNGDYEYSFPENKLNAALIILDGNMLSTNGSEALNDLDITDLATVQWISGSTAQLIYPKEMETHESIVSVMTKGYMATPAAKANINMALRAADISNRQLLRPATTLMAFNPDTRKTLLNGEERDDLTASNLFEVYGKRYSYHFSVRRQLAILLYGKEFVGTYQGVFFPYIDGENTSADVFYEKINELKEKIDLNESGFDPDIVSEVAYHIERKESLDQAQETLRWSEEINSGKALIVLNDYVRNDLSFKDLKQMDISNLEVLNEASARPLYGKHMAGKSYAIKVSSSVSSNIEYSNVMDPRDLEDNKNLYKLPPFQSEVEAFDKVLLQGLLEDKKVDNEEEITVILEKDKMLVNFETQPKRILKRYHKLYENVMGFPLSEEITYYFKKD